MGVLAHNMEHHHIWLILPDKLEDLLPVLHVSFHLRTLNCSMMKKQKKKTFSPWVNTPHLRNYHLYLCNGKAVERLLCMAMKSPKKKMK